MYNNMIFYVMFVIVLKASLSDPDKGPGTILSTLLSVQTSLVFHKVCNRYKNIAIISGITNMMKAGYRG